LEAAATTAATTGTAVYRNLCYYYHRHSYYDTSKLEAAATAGTAVYRNLCYYHHHRHSYNS
jgi:hypothetical protein